MERDEAIALLDPSGMLVKMGIPSDQIVQSLDTNRWSDMLRCRYVLRYDICIYIYISMIGKSHVIRCSIHFIVIYIYI